MDISLAGLELETITVRSSQVWKENVSFKQGKSYLLKAPSGSGKSTIIHVLYGLRKDYNGTVRMDETDIRTMKPDQWSYIRSFRMSIVFQDLRLFDNLTVRENLTLKRNLSAYPDRMEEYSQILDIDAFMDKPAGKLSVGQRQRAAIIRALLQPFEFILLDEPFSHLDPTNAERAAKLIDTRRKEENAGLILTTLDQEPSMPINEILRL